MALQKDKPVSRLLVEVEGLIGAINLASTIDAGNVVKTPMQANVICQKKATSESCVDDSNRQHLLTPDLGVLVDVGEWHLS